MKQKKKINVRLLRRIQKHILAEPMRVDMMNWAKTDLSEVLNPPCGTTACIAGWGLILNGSRAKNIEKMSMDKIAAKASRLLGLNYTKPYPLEEWDGPAKRLCENSVSLFLVDAWPERFRYKYETEHNKLQLAETRRDARKVKRRLAKITSQRIDFFVKTGK